MQSTIQHISYLCKYKHCISSLYHNCLPNLNETDHLALSLYFVYSVYDFQMGKNQLDPLKKVLTSSWIPQNSPN